MNSRQPNIIGNAEDFFAPPEDEDEPRNVSLFAHEIDARAKTPRQLHEVCQKAHFFMPCASSPVCNKHFLADVLCGKCYMPKNNEIRQKAVFGSPPTEELRQCLMRGLKSIGNPKMLLLAQYLDQRKADRQWLLVLLATLDVDKQLDYFKPRRLPLQELALDPFIQQNRQENARIQLPADVVAAFKMTPIQPATKGSKGSATSNLFKSKEEVELGKLVKIQRQQEKLEERKQAQENRIAALQNP